MALFICQSCGVEHQTWDGACPNCGGSQTIRLSPNTDRMVDRVIKGKFKILRKLGQGGMGAVYLAEQVGIGHRVAVKFLKSEYSTDPEIAKRFINEAKIFGRVAHPNAVSLNEFGQDEEGNLYIAMEYCEGVDLKKVIAEQGRLPLVEGIDVVLQVADVLVNAHANGVVHRDLKPENIMIRRGLRGMHAKVLDFGIARLMDAGTKLTVAGAIAGTPRYMSPEQVEGRPDVDHRADIYSLGIVLFEVLTGRQPFDGNTIAEILRKQSNEPMPHLGSAAPDRDYPDLDAVLQRACAKPREARWADMLAFASALSQAVPTQAHLGMSPMQRSSVHFAITATPHPGMPTALDAVPNNATPASPTEGLDGPTLLKGATPHPAAGATALNLTGRAISFPGTTGSPTAVGGQSLAQPIDAPPKSKAPMVAVALVAVGVLGAGGWLAMSGGTSKTDAPREAPVDAGSPTVVTPEPKAPSTDTAVLQRFAEQQQAKLDLSNGQTEFDTHKLDNAETYLKKVPKDSDLFGQAEELLKKIAQVRDLLGRASAEYGKGRCEAASKLYQDVLKLNARHPDALAGLSRCREAAIDQTMQ